MITHRKPRRTKKVDQRRGPWATPRGGISQGKGPLRVLYVELKRAEFVAALPRKVVAAAALITDLAGRVLIVEPTYKPRWEAPGGCVESGESAREACQREIREDLGVSIDVGRFLVIEHQTAPDDKGDSIMLVYDGGELSGTENCLLPVDELKSARFVSLDELAEVAPRISGRLAAALTARATGELVELTNGEPFAEKPS